MAVRACHVGVNGCRVGVFGDEDRHLLAPAGAREFLVGVTREASLIVLGRCVGSGQAEDRGRYEKPVLRSCSSRVIQPIYLARGVWPSSLPRYLRNHTYC
jgi:hypothetical protein